MTLEATSAIQDFVSHYHAERNRQGLAGTDSSAQKRTIWEPQARSTHPRLVSLRLKVTPISGCDRFEQARQSVRSKGCGAHGRDHGLTVVPVV